MKNIVSKIDYNAPVVLSFALISLVVLLLGFLSNGATTHLFFTVYSSSFADPLTYVRMFGHVLGHANLEHYVNNMMMFLLVGPMLEEKYGSKLLAGMIAITAVVTGVFNAVFFSTGLLGASGVVFMMIILSSATSVKEGKIPLTLIVVILLYLGEQIFSGVFSRDNISQITHILGGVCGGVFGMIYSKRTEPMVKDLEQ